MNDGASSSSTMDVTGPMPATFKISSFPAPATTSIRPTLRKVTFDELVKLLTTHERRQNKDGRGWSGASYKPGTMRANKNVVEWSVAGADFDHFTMDQYIELRELLEGAGLAFIMYSTYSSSDDDFRFRVAIPLTKPVPAAQYTDVWHRINTHLIGGRNDPQTKDPSRMLYTPAAPEGVPVVAEHRDGLALDWEKLPEAPVSARRAAVGPATSGHTRSVSRDVLLFTIEGAPNGQQRGMALRAARSYLSAGKTVDEATELVWRGLQASPIGDADNPWTEEQSREIVEDIASREPPPLEEWPDFRFSDGPTVDEDSNGYFSPPENGRNGSTTAEGTHRQNGHAASPGSADKTPSDPDEPIDVGGMPPLGRQLTESGNAERFHDRRGNDIRYCHPWAQWLYWSGTHWKRDTVGRVRQWGKGVMRSIYAEAARIENPEVRAATVAWAKRSETAAARAAMLKLAEVEPGVPILPEQMDADPFLFNVVNGTIDLRNGGCRPHDRRDLLTKLTPVTYDPEATCPTFLAFLERVLPDPEVRAFEQRVTGYSLTGDTSEQCLFFLHGGGANGKSTRLAVQQSLMGEYARQAAPELLLARKGERHPTEIADLFGARAVMSVEVDDGKRMAETLVKQMTGGDKMKGRFMRADFFEFDPTHKLFLAANHRPEVRGTDYAIWRRIHLIPYTVTIPPEERDPKLLSKLIAELPGILNWAIEGCLDWQRGGLRVPATVQAATAEYRAEQDIIGSFISDCCVLAPNAWASTQALYGKYKGWAETMGEYAISGKAFGMRLDERGLVAARRTVANERVRGRAGIGLRDDRNES